jgi:hypothetical protein
MSCSNNQEFNENSQVTRETFPCLKELRDIFYKEDFNALLYLIKNRIIQAKRANQNSARINYPEIANLPQQVVTDVKHCLRTKDFIIVDVEDAAGVASGFKVNF